MRLKTNDGLDFWGCPLKTFVFDFVNFDKVYTIVTKYNNTDYVVGTFPTPEGCKGKVRSFVGKFKLPVSVKLVTLSLDDNIDIADQYDYDYEKYLRWSIKKKRLQQEKELLNS